jgi:hypothetical protein
VLQSVTEQQRALNALDLGDAGRLIRLSIAGSSQPPSNDQDVQRSDTSGIDLLIRFRSAKFAAETQCCWIAFGYRAVYRGNFSRQTDSDAAAAGRYPGQVYPFYPG